MSSPFGDWVFDPEKQAYLHVSVPVETIRDQIAQQLIADHERKLEAALVLLGWTPPSDPRPTQDAYNAACRALHHWRDEAARLAKLAGVEPRQMEH